MADETRIDPEGVSRVFTVVDEVGADVGVALRRVETIRTTRPAPWGDDEHGQKFANTHEQNSADILTGVGEQVSFIGTFTSEGRGAVQEFQDLDEVNGRGLAP